MKLELKKTCIVSGITFVVSAVIASFMFALFVLDAVGSLNKTDEPSFRGLILMLVFSGIALVSAVIFGTSGIILLKRRLTKK